ncbi:Pentatricopeptide repeat-containing protein [Cynara cardunculus var. scolymus]|uniref:Pentatricopeptide repeat-containing protein n=1 Tax=Cynara cardunculus var. scolymus TaxID=59895 RepID=A0A118K4K0_CYNCS|nr:Pentatricopeptide repeat-containing protein [Cynara cardunculus var. scolymus]
MLERNDACWNAMISGFSIHGHCKEALEFFDRMVKSSMNPNEISFLSVLTACAHSGFVQEGLETFSKMVSNGNVNDTEIAHFTVEKEAQKYQKNEKSTSCMKYEACVSIDHRCFRVKLVICKSDFNLNRTESFTSRIKMAEIGFAPIPIFVQSCSKMRECYSSKYQMMLKRGGTSRHREVLILISITLQIMLSLLGNIRKYNPRTLGKTTLGLILHATSIFLIILALLGFHFYNDTDNFEAIDVAITYLLFAAEILKEIFADSPKSRSTVRQGSWPRVCIGSRFSSEIDNVKTFSVEPVYLSLADNNESELLDRIFNVVDSIQILFCLLVDLFCGDHQVSDRVERLHDVLHFIAYRGRRWERTTVVVEVAACHGGDTDDDGGGGGGGGEKEGERIIDGGE